MKRSSRTGLKRADRSVVAWFEAAARVEHGTLPGTVDLAEYIDELQLREMGVLDSEGHRVPVTVLALDRRKLSGRRVEWVMEEETKGPFYAVWTADNNELEFIIVSSEFEAMKALREIYHAALSGTAFVKSGFDGLRIGTVSRG